MKEKRLLFFALFLFLLVLPSNGWGDEGTHFLSTRPKIGLALGGGGAKGFAHIGVIKVLEANGIPIDMVAGTSIGAIAGGLYASGRDGAALEKLTDSVDWLRLFGIGYENERFFELTNQITYKVPFYFDKEEELLVHEEGVVLGDKILLFLRGETGGITFNQLRLPFKATAVDLLSGKLQILDQGEVALAMRSSFAVPGVFAPVNTGGMLLVDGGILDNLPVDVVRSMGADIVIAVDLSALEPRKKDSFTSILSVVERFEELQHWTINSPKSKEADIVIKPDVKGIGLLEFDKQREARKAGEVATLLKIEEIRAYIKSYREIKQTRLFGNGLSKSNE